MNTYIVPGPFIYIALGLFIFLIAACLIILIRFIMLKKSDYIIMLDGDKSFRIIRPKIREKTKYEENNRTYPLSREAMRVSDKGKKLFIFENNKPGALVIQGNKEKWITAEALKEVINNEIIKLMLKVNDKKDILILIAMAASCIGAFASCLVAAKIFGLIKG